MVFYGEYEVSFSAPGRIVVPKKIRDLLPGTTFVLSRGYGQCLAGYARPDWDARAGDLVDVSLLDNEQIQKRRMIFSSASVVEIDEQGRFVIPKALVHIADLSKKATIVGVGDHFEIWNEEAWQQESSTYHL